MNAIAASCTGDPAPSLGRWQVALLGGAALLFWVTYPLALLPVGFVALMHDWRLSGNVLLAVASLLWLLTADRWPRRWLLATLGVYWAALAWGALRFPSAWEDSLVLLGYVSVPLAAASLARGGRLRLDGRWGTLTAALWAMQVCLGYWAWYFDQEVVGYPGNRNWMAAFLLGLWVWAAAWLEQRWRPSLPGTARRWALVLALTGGLTLPLLWQCQSRGAWLALTVLGLVGLGQWWRGWRRWLFLAVLLVAAVVALWTVLLLGREPLLRALEADVRVPLWGRTAALIADHPLGVGPGQFRRVFTPYRAASTYHRRQVAATVTIHPHNEFLDVAAQLGVAAGLAWLLLFWPVLRPRGEAGPELTCARITAGLYLVHSCLDQVYMMEPGSYLAWVCLGICWAPHLGEPRPRLGQRRFGRALLAGAALLLTGLGAWVLGRDALATWWTRGARLAESQDRAEPAIALYLRAAALVPDDPSLPYRAGRLLLYAANRPAEALTQLRRVARLDPDYAHLNRFLCRLALGERQGPAALAFAAREVQLYPFSPEAHQALFQCQVMQGRFDRLPGAESFLAFLYREWTGLGSYAEGDRARAQVAAWTRAVQAGDAQAALAGAKELTNSSFLEFLDPLLALRRGMLPGGWEQDLKAYTGADFAYWRFCAELRRLGPAAVTGPADLAALGAALRERVQLRAADLPGESPEESWRAGAAGPGNWAKLLVQALAVRQVPALLWHGPGGEVQGCVAAWPKGGIWTLALADNRSRELAPATLREWLGAGGGERARAWFHPREFLLKNHALAAIAGGPAEAPDGFLPQRIPLVAELRWFSLAGRADAKIGELLALLEP